jgi:NitT/TauT family transport system permease protein
MDIVDERKVPQGATSALMTATAPQLARPSLIRRAGWIAMPMLTFVILMVLWGVAVEALQIPKYILPAPLEVIERLISDWGSIMANAQYTVIEILVGLLIAIVLAVPLGLVIALSTATRQTLYPLVVFIQLIPKIAVAPLFLVWFGFGMESKIILTALMSWFPILQASISGFQAMDPRLLYITRSMGASLWQTFRFLRFPGALPIVFSGIKTATAFATTAAIVAEFIGSNRGLGYQLLYATGVLDTPLIFAVLVVLTVIGIGLHYIVEGIEALVTPWRRHARSRA